MDDSRLHRKGFAVTMLLLLFGVIPHTHEVVDYVDLIEINHVYSKEGRFNLDQFLFCDLRGGIYQVKDFILIHEREELSPKEYLIKRKAFWDAWATKHGKGKAPPYVHEWTGSRLVWFDYNRRRWKCRFKDRRGISRLIYAKCFRETWTNYDPEVRQKDIVPDRIPLKKPLPSLEEALK